MTPSCFASLLCSLCLAVVHLPRYGSLECLPRDLEDPDTTKVAPEDGRSHLSLLQNSFYVAQDHPWQGSADAPAMDTYTAEDRNNFGFLPTKEEIATNPFVHYEDAEPYIPSMHSEEVKYADQGSKPRVALAAQQSNLSQNTTTVQTTDSGMNWITVLVVSLAGAAIALFVFLLAWGQRSATYPEAERAVVRSHNLSDRFHEAVMGSLPSRSASHSNGGGGDPLGFIKNPTAMPTTGDVVQDVAINPPLELDADTFGMSVCSLTRDTYFMSIEGVSFARSFRVVSSIALVLITVGIQVFLLAKIKQFVSARAVHDIRESYDTYELAIYGLENTTLTVNGKHRGIPGTLPALDVAMVRLMNMTEDDRDNACRIPMSQPHFFGVVLLIWTLSCIAELRKAWNLQATITMLETVPTMAQAMIRGEDESTEGDGIIRGMTIGMKCLITIIMFIPRVAITLYLLYVGCRWLLATTDFSDLVMNAIALEFILLIKDTLYLATVPARSTLDLKLTLIEPYPKKLTPTWLNFANSFLLLVIANLFVYMYMRHWQAVLPEYRWDVHDVCVQYIKDRYAV